MDLINIMCSELISFGFLKDEGIGRFEFSSLEYFVSTDSTKWLFDWIIEK